MPRLHTSDGGALHLIETGDRDATPLVLVHGISLGAKVWSRQQTGLADRFRVLAIDLRGHGSSTAGRDGYGIDVHARDIASVLNDLDLRDAIVVGHSMGGMVVQRLCADHAATVHGRVAGLVFLSTSPGLRIPAPVERALGSSIGAVARRTPGRLGASLASGVGMLGHDAARSLASTTTPSLVVVGSRDFATPRSFGQRVARALSNARLETIAGGGHLLMRQRPDELGRLLRSFADEVARAH